MNTIPQISDKEFGLFQSLIHREVGIHLNESKKALLVGRLARRLRELGLNSFEDYYSHVVDERGDNEKVLMFDCISTNETQFFREPWQFEFLEHKVFPEWQARADVGLHKRRIRIWSSACSTGEEPYTLAMLLWNHFPPAAGWECEILATDLSTSVLEKAQTAVWPMERAKEIPLSYLHKFMLRGKRTQEGMMKAGPQIRSLIKFQRLNLNEDVYALTGPFDLIFCRNVLIYFTRESKKHVINRLLDYLEPSGYLFLGHAENLHDITDRVRAVIPAVYAPALKKTGLIKTP
jgi:chemotaxis protein methyltransferase CheR